MQARRAAPCIMRWVIPGKEIMGQNCKTDKFIRWKFQPTVPGANLVIIIKMLGTLAWINLLQ